MAHYEPKFLFDGYDDRQDPEYVEMMDFICRVESFQADKLGRWLIEKLSPSSVIDVGCGPGIYLLPFVEKGIPVLGVDACSRGGEKLPEGCFERVDLRFPYAPQKRYDLAICMEVAEHLERHWSERLVDTLWDCADVILFTAAVPGQGGTYHFNEQPHEFWLEMFRERHGYVVHPLQAELRAFLATLPDWCEREQGDREVSGWLLNNSFLLYRAEAKPTVPPTRRVTAETLVPNTMTPTGTMAQPANPHDVPVFWIEATLRCRRYLRRYADVKESGTPCTKMYGNHPASTHEARVPIEDGVLTVKEWGEYDRLVFSADPEEWPREDPRWPTHCECGCGYEFKPTDYFQLFTEQIYINPATGEETTLRDAPPGALYDAFWLGSNYCVGYDGIHLTCITPSGPWMVDGVANNCTKPQDKEHRCWVRTGDPTDPQGLRTGVKLNVGKNGNTCAAGAGSILMYDGWHGFLHNGRLYRC